MTRGLVFLLVLARWVRDWGALTYWLLILAVVVASFMVKAGDAPILPSEPLRLQPRTLGNTAVMHVYYYSPKTLEVTYVDSYLFKDEAACKDAIPRADMISAPLASQGDLISITCVGVSPPPHADEPKPGKSGVKEL